MSWSSKFLLSNNYLNVFLTGRVHWYRVSYKAVETKSFPLLNLDIFINENPMLLILGWESFTGVQCGIIRYQDYFTNLLGEGVGRGWGGGRIIIQLIIISHIWKSLSYSQSRQVISK